MIEYTSHFNKYLSLRKKNKKEKKEKEEESNL